MFPIFAKGPLELSLYAFRVTSSFLSIPIPEPSCTSIPSDYEPYYAIALLDLSFEASSAFPVTAPMS